MKSSTISFLLLVVLALIWGSSFILMKKAMFAPDGSAIFSSAQVAALRILLAGLVLAPFGLRRWDMLRGRSGVFLLVSGLVGSTIPAFLFTAAQQHIASALAGMLNALTPLFTFTLGMLLFRVPFERRGLAGVIIGLLGALCLIYFKQGAPLEINAFALLIILATSLYGFNINVLKTHLSQYPSLQVSALSLMLMVPAMAIVVAYLDTYSIVQSHPEAANALGYILILSVLSTSLGLVLFNRLIQLQSALFASSVTYFIPIAAIGWGVLDGERISAMQYFGMAMILAGVWVVNRRRRHKKNLQTS